MAIRNVFTPAALNSQDLQVDYSHTQWRHAQMLQQERGYLAACASVEEATA